VLSNTGLGVRQFYVNLKWTTCHRKEKVQLSWRLGTDTSPLLWQFS
jgi:hypothetical protein